MYVNIPHCFAAESRSNIDGYHPMPKGQHPTFFAPTEKASIDEIQHQYELISTLSHIRELFDGIPDVLLILNEKRQVIFYNKAASELSSIGNSDSMYGLRPGELFDCDSAESAGGCGISETCQKCGAMLAILSALQGKQEIKECRFTRKDGLALDFRVWATSRQIGDEDFVILSMQDISAEKRRRVLERIFFHDINNIISRFQAINWLLEDYDFNQFNEIKSKIELLSAELIEHIRAQQDLTDAENNELVVRPVQLSSLQLLGGVVEFYRIRKSGKQLNLMIDKYSQDLLFTSDEILMKRIIGNLIKNALEASIPGQVVTVGCKEENNRIHFWVHNEACIDPQIKLQVFKRSFSTKGEGRGLGTYSIKLLTERYLKGDISFVTSPENGTTFNAVYPFDLER